MSRWAASVRDDARIPPSVTLVGLPPEEALQISLLAEILGWQVETAMPRMANGAVLVRGEQAGRAARHRADAAALRPESDDVLADSAPDVQGRLVLRCVGSVIRAEVDDPAIARQLAALGLDRLVMPVPLAVVEQLLVFAG